MGVKGVFTHHASINQYTTNPFIRFMKRNNGLGKGVSSKNEKIGAILDGGGSHYTIGDVEIGLLHAHSNDTSQVLRGLIDKIGSKRESNKLLSGDMNMSLSRSKSIIKASNIDLENLATVPTYPYYFYESGGGIVTKTINGIMRKGFLSHPDQIFVNPGIITLDQRTLGPKETGLKSDHTMNHLIYRTISQSLR